MSPSSLQRHGFLAVPALLLPILLSLMLLLLLAGVRPAAATVLPALPSAAAATLSNFYYELIDLAPCDGIAPWIRFDGATADLDAGIYLDAGGYTVDASGRAFEHGRLALAHRGNLAGGMADASGASAAVGMLDRSGYAYMASLFSFALSPWTRVVFGADAAVDTRLAPGAQRSWAIAGLSGVFEDGVTGESALYGTLETSASGGASARLRVSGDAAGAGAAGHLLLFANALAWASREPAAVPEAPGAALLGLGLLMLAGAACRRPGRRAQPGAALAPAPALRRRLRASG